MARASDGRRWWRHRGTPRRRTRVAEAARGTVEQHRHGALCWMRARTRGASRRRWRFLMRRRRALGRAHRRRLRWALGPFLNLRVGDLVRDLGNYDLGFGFWDFVEEMGLRKCKQSGFMKSCAPMPLLTHGMSVWLTLKQIILVLYRRIMCTYQG